VGWVLAEDFSYQETLLFIMKKLDPEGSAPND
jgi:hypothetical protein